MRFFVTILLSILTACNISAQQNRLKLGFMGFPTAAGFGIGCIGYERLDKGLSSSWQLHLNAAAGEIGNDAGAEKRIWGTIEKTFYKKTTAERITWSYSFFTEVGTREKDAGKVYTTPAKTFRETKTTEINPGVSIGLQYRIRKRWRIESQIGPKLIFANGNHYYYNSITNQLSKESANSIKAGFRFTGLLSYQF
jgi:hypothetical protein